MYIVPSCQVIKHNGRIYGAGQTVPGYTVPTKPDVKKTRAKKPIIKEEVDELLPEESKDTGGEDREYSRYDGESDIG